MEKYVKSSDMEIENYLEIINNNLYFAVLKSNNVHRKLKGNNDIFCFTIDEELIYQNYYCDFGPLNLSCLYKYCMRLNKYLQYSRGLKAIVHYTSSNPNKKANAAFLVGSYCIIFLKILPKNVIKMIQELGPYKPFLDASQLPCNFNLRLLDCYNAIHKALAFNFFNFHDFNSSEYDLYNKLEFGDLNWLVPRKFLAFIGPADNRTAHPPEFYIKYFLKNDVKTVIRLNHILYDAHAFLQAGIQHYDLIFPDGTTPPKDILLKFLYIAENAPAAIAVHCKAGLGRTGSLIGAYLIKHYRMTARESIAWLRICRPGSVIGQQQLYLEQMQSWLWRTGSQYRLQHYGEGDKIPRHKYGIYSKQWPLERDKLIRDARRNLQHKFAKNQLEDFLKKKNKSISIDRMVGNSSKCLSDVNSTGFKTISKLLSSVHGITDNMKNRDEDYPVQHDKLNTKSEKYIPKNSSRNNGPEESFRKKLIMKPSPNMLATVPKLIEHKFMKCPPPTQGDKLNEIKALRHNRAKLKKTIKN